MIPDGESNRTQMEPILLMIENMFTVTSADQQRKDASIARYFARSNLHAIQEPSEMWSKQDPSVVKFHEPVSSNDDDFAEMRGSQADEDDDYSL